MTEKDDGCGNVVSYGHYESVSNRLLHPSCQITPTSWISLSLPDGWVDHKSRLAVTWQELRCELSGAVRLWQCVYSHVNCFLRYNVWIWLSVYKHTLSSNRQHCTSEDIRWTVCVFLCSWTCSGRFSVITVSTVQLQTVQFVQYL